MNTVVSSTAVAAAALQPTRAWQAGMQFEAVLLNTVLGSLEQSFSHLPGGKKEDHASEGYSSMAMQALTSGLARSGGIGLGKMIAGELLRNSQRNHPASGGNEMATEPALPLKDF
jgi:Rod binding domain-containing protein